MNFLNRNLARVSKLSIQFLAFSIATALVTLVPSFVQTYAQDRGREIRGVGRISASELATIEAAPFSQVFSRQRCVWRQRSRLQQ